MNINPLPIFIVLLGSAIGFIAGDSLRGAVIGGAIPLALVIAANIFGVTRINIPVWSLCLAAFMGAGALIGYIAGGMQFLAIGLILSFVVALFIWFVILQMEKGKQF